MENETEELEKFKELIKKHYKGDKDTKKLKEIEDYFIVDFNFSEAHKILNMKQMSDEEDKIFYNGMYICAKNILKDLINKYYPNEKKSKLLEILDKRFPIKYIAAEFSRLRLFIKMSEEEQKRYGDILRAYI